MSLSNHTQSVSDMQLEEMLLSLKEPESTEPAPPVVNTFRLEMEAERRRSRIQLEIVTIAAFVSVMSTVIFTSFFFRFMLPELMAKSDRLTREMLVTFQSALDSAFKPFGGIFIAIGLLFALGVMISAVLLISKRNEIFTQKK